MVKGALLGARVAYSGPRSWLLKPSTLLEVGIFVPNLSEQVGNTDVMNQQATVSHCKDRMCVEITSNDA